MNAKPKDIVIANARIVLADRVIEQGWLALADGRIAEIGEGRAPAGAEDAGGDLIMPGLIELHTDHLEAHYVPRPKVFWNPVAAVVSYDGQLATSGITTVFDSLRVWREDGAEEVDGRAGVLAAAITTARDADLLRADHFLHLRCEIPMPSVVEEAKELVGRPDVRLMSLMDHTPGQRQFRDEVKLRDYYRGKGGGKTDAELDELFAKRFEYQKAYAATNMRQIVALAHGHNIPLASHDDTTEENVADAVRDRIVGGGIPDHAGGRARPAPGRHRHPHGRAECRSRRLAFRQHRRGRSRPRRPAGYPVVRLHPLQPLDGRAATAGARARDRSGGGDPHRDEDAG